MSTPETLTRSQVQVVINRGPFNRFSRMDFVGYARDRAFYEVNPAVWKHLSRPENRIRATELCENGIRSYYDGLAKRQA